MTLDEQWMLRALELAEKGMGSVSPNPLVGCLVVHDNKIIGEGWHRQYGQAHAEVNALAAVADKALLPDSTVYVNLEPCAHHGKTPPCADLLIEKKIKAVVVAHTDPNPLVSGRGIARLQAAGISVTTGVLEAAGRQLNRRFLTFMEHKRPYIILKWAQTQDGFIARETFESRWISNAWSRRWVHRWRTEEDAVLVGTRTAACDDPHLSVREWSGRNPVRIVIDRGLKLSESLHIFDRQQPTLCYNLLKDAHEINLVRVRLEEKNFLRNLLHDLFERKIQSVIVEGGAFTLRQFIDQGLWDEARVFESAQAFQKGIAAPVLRGRQVAEKQIGSDRLRWLVPFEAKTE